jgi:hypothetical protein
VEPETFYIPHWDNYMAAVQLVTTVKGPGINVMITIFGDICQYLAKKMTFFPKKSMLRSIFEAKYFEAKSPFFSFKNIDLWPAIFLH